MLPYLVVYQTVMNRRRRCPVCRKLQVVDQLDADGRYHCKQCGHRFTREELKAAPESS
jgi:transcription elongation factor Elf1